MVSRYQIKEVGRLIKKGWVVIGPATSLLGSGTLMRSPDGKEFLVDGAGKIIPIEEK